MKIELTLSIGFVGARHRALVEVNDAPDGLSEDDLLDWLHEHYWEDWASGYIDGGVSIVERDEEVRG